MEEKEDWVMHALSSTIQHYLAKAGVCTCQPFVLVQLLLEFKSYDFYQNDKESSVPL